MRWMKELAVVAAALSLTGCGNQESASGPASKGDVPAASTRIIQNVTGVQVAQDSPAPSRSSAKPPAPAIAHQARPGSQARYRAIGTEPFWAVTVKGSLATLERPDKEPMRFPISRNDDGRTVRYLGEGFSMTVSEGPCSDGMSDAVWADHVAIAFGEGTLNGCGGVRQDP